MRFGHRAAEDAKKPCRKSFTLARYDSGVVLTVTRTSEKDVQYRQIIMTVDGNEFATLLYGQTVTKPLAPGHHTIKAYNTLVWKTLEFDLAEGEHVYFSVVNIPGKWSFPLVALLGAGPIYVELTRTTAPPTAAN